MAAAPGAIRYVCIDVANGYTEAFVAFVKKVRETYPDIVLMAGNVVTGDMTEELLLLVPTSSGGHRPGLPSARPAR